jgi:hypothetical protein
VWPKWLNTLIAFPWLPQLLALSGPSAAYKLAAVIPSHAAAFRRPTTDEDRCSRSASHRRAFPTLPDRHS